MKQENRGRVRKICTPLSRWVHVGNNLIADNYNTTQQLDTATRIWRDSLDKLYYSNEHRCNCYKTQDSVGYLRIGRGHEFDHGMERHGKTYMV